MDEVRNRLKGAAESTEPRTLGEYRILRQIGRGGMGVVYEAEQISLNRRVALKVLPFVDALDERQLGRFHNEARAAAHLHHAHIVPIFAVGCDGDTHYYAMQYIDGQSLDRLIEQLRNGGGSSGSKSANHGELVNASSKLPPTVRLDEESDLSRQQTEFDIPAQQAVDSRSPGTPVAQTRAHLEFVVRVGIQAADALDYAHRQGIVHRDVKPGNLLLDETGKIWITDFGLALIASEANLTVSGGLLGTLRYMSPEQLEGGRALVDHSTDIYSLGVTLYELLMLRPPFADADVRSALNSTAERDPIPPRRLNRRIPVDLETIILRCLEKASVDRYPTAAELRDDLQRFLADRPIRARRPTVAERVRKWSRRHRAAVWTGVVFLLVTTVGLSISTAVALQAQVRTERALSEARLNAHQARNAWQQAEDSARQAHQAAANESRQAQLARTLLYAADTRLAFKAWRDGDPWQFRNRVMRYAAGSTSAEVRGPEWNFLRRLAEIEPERELALNGGVYQLRHSPDGTRVAACGQAGFVWILDAATGEIQRTLATSQIEVNGVAFSPDGRKLASAGDDGTVRLWDLATGEERLVIDAHPHLAFYVLFAADGTLVTCGDDPTIRLWDAVSGASRGVLEGHTEPLEAIALAADKRTLASGGRDGTIRWWDLHKRAATRTVDAHDSKVFCLAFSPDGSLLASGGNDHLVRLWDRQGRRLYSRELLHDVHSVAFLADGNRLAAGDRSGTVRLWPVGVGPSRGITAEGSPLVWAGHGDRVYALAVSPEGDSLITGGGDGVVRWWDRSRLPLNVCRTLVGTKVHDVVPADDGRLLYVAHADGMTVWELSQETIVDTLRTPDRSCRRVDGSFPAGFYVTGDAEGTIELRNRYGSSEEHTRVIAENAGSHSLRLSPDGRLLAVTSWTHDFVRLIEVPGGTTVAEWHAPAPHDAVFSPDGRLLATNGPGDTVDIRRVESFEKLPALEGHTRAVRAFAFNPDTTLLATGGDDYHVKLWSPEQGTEFATLTGHGNSVRALAFSPDGRTLASSDQNGTLTLWNVSTRQKLFDLARYEVPITRLAFAATGQLICLRGDGRIVLFDMSPHAQ